LPSAVSVTRGKRGSVRFSEDLDGFVAEKDFHAEMAKALGSPGYYGISPRLMTVSEMLK